MKRTPVLPAIALVLLGNVVALIGVSRNRAAGPLRTFELTENELPLPETSKDNSGIDLTLRWLRPSAPNPEPVLDRARLEKLGFDFTAVSRSQGVNPSILPREAYIVLQYRGEIWKERVQSREEEIHRNPPAAGAAAEPLFGSGLVVVDASAGLPDLVARYPDQSKHLIVRAVVRARVQFAKSPPDRSTDFTCAGWIAQILPPVIHVPLPHAAILHALGPRSPGQESRYMVTLAYGRYLEPWVTSVRLTR